MKLPLNGIRASLVYICIVMPEEHYALHATIRSNINYQAQRYGHQGYFATSGFECLAIIVGSMNFALYQKVFQEDIKQSVGQFKGSG